MKSYGTRIGELSFTHDFANGYPADETVERLYDERDFQRACQAYLWALPFVSFAQWRYTYRVELGAANGEVVYTETYREKMGGLTYNMSTPYALPFIDLDEEGPYVMEIPAGEYRGAIHDAWQVEITRKPAPGTYLFVGPGQDVPDGAEDVVDGVFESPTVSILAGLRVMAEDEGERHAWLERLSLYPWAERANPRPRGYRRPDDKEWLGTPPRGITYWERLAEAINREPVFERDRFFMAMLKPLGIEKGGAFEPGERETQILTEATFAGEAMAKANDFAKRMDAAHYVDGSQWEYATVSHPINAKSSTTASTSALPGCTKPSPTTSRCTDRRPAKAKSTCRPTKTPAEHGSTEARTTCCDSRPMSRLKCSGRSVYTTSTPAACCATTTTPMAHTAHRAKTCTRTTTARSISTSARNGRPAARRTGSRPCPARRGFPTSASTHPGRRFSTRAGYCPTSSTSHEPVPKRRPVGDRRTGLHMARRFHATGQPAQPRSPETD